MAVVASGAWGTVEWAIDENGKRPASDYYEALGVSDKAKVLALFQRLADTGEIKNEEKFKKIRTGGVSIWEFKSFQLRFLGDFRPRKRFLVAHGLRKKTGKHRPADVAVAVRILREFDGREKI